MRVKRPRLTPSVASKIVAGIRSGGYPHVAALAWGVPQEVFDAWLKRGLDAKAREPYRSFAREVCVAHAQARLRAEVELFEADSKTWLVHGPGRETEENAGWSVSVKPAESAAAERNAWLTPEVMRLFHMVLQVLMPFPEARVAVAQVLMSQGVELKV